MQTAGSAPESHQTTARPSAPAHVQAHTSTRHRLLTAAELLALLLLTAALTAPYLNFNLVQMPAGYTFPAQIQGHYFWARLQACGMCAFWNGNVHGGVPALVAPAGSPLHPLVAGAVLLFGVLNGSKLALAGAFLMAGLAQWWLGVVLGLGRVARTWMAAMAVLAGHLSGRMENGSFGLVLAAAAAALVLPPLVLLLHTGTRRAAVLLGVALGLLLLTGQAHLIIGLLLCLPAALVLWPWQTDQSLGMLRRVALAGGLALLLAAPALVPLLHTLPAITWVMVPDFSVAPPVFSLVLTLVIADPDFYQSELLGLLRLPHLYLNYIGWIPLLLALGSMHAARSAAEWRLVVFFVLFALLAFWAAAATSLAWIAAAAPFAFVRDAILGLHQHPVIAALAVPPLLALAGFTLDRMLRAAWPPLRLGTLALSTRWVLLLPLLLALGSAWSFSRQWIASEAVPPAVDVVAETLETPDLQWVALPAGDARYIERALRADLKLSPGIHPWDWRTHPPPAPVLAAEPDDPPPDMLALPPETLPEMPLYVADTGREYAAVRHDDGTRTVCQAQGSGGHIDVTCDLPQPGTLTVKETRWHGWQAHRSGEPLALNPDAHWLTVELPAGEQQVALRYRPWDVWVGLALLLVGLALAGYSWRQEATP